MSIGLNFTGSNRKVFLYRGTKEILEKKNTVYPKYKIIVELPDDFQYENKNELLGMKFPYKIGDGEHAYCDLPYEPETIPVGFIS